MKTVLYVGCLRKRTKNTSNNNFTYKWIPIDSFTNRATKLGLTVSKIEPHDNKYNMYGCEHTYKITFKFKRNQKEEMFSIFKELLSLPIIKKGFKTAENL